MSSELNHDPIFFSIFLFFVFGHTRTRQATTCLESQPEAFWFFASGKAGRQDRQARQADRREAYFSRSFSASLLLLCSSDKYHDKGTPTSRDLVDPDDRSAASAYETVAQYNMLACSWDVGSAVPKECLLFVSSWRRHFSMNPTQTQG